MTKKRLTITFFFLVLCLAAGTLYAADLIIGGDVTHTVKKGETLQRIGARYGVFWKAVAVENNLDPAVAPPEGAVLKINTRKIVPKVIDDGIIINIPDRTLYFFQEGKLTPVPVGLGLIAKTEVSDWKTPTGKFSIIRKRKNPTWYVPESIQIENAMKGKEVEESVPPGPKNPLGKYAIETSIPGVLIHSTIWPGSVYRYMSHGCIRVLPEDMEQLFPMVEPGTEGEIIYEPVKVALVDNSRVYLEVRTDVYKRFKSMKKHVAEIIESRGLSDKVDWKKIDMLIEGESGVAQDVTFEKPKPVQVAVKTDKVAANTGITQRFIDFIKSCFKKSM